MSSPRPPDLRLVLRQVVALYDQSRFRSMLTACRQAKQLASAAPALELAELSRQEGIALHCLRRHEEALAAYAVARATAPLDNELQVMLRMNEAMVHEDQGDARKAVAELKSLCESPSTPPELLGSVLLALGSALKDSDPLAAAAVYRQVLETGGDDDESSGIAAFSLGNILTQVDELDDAARAYDAAWASYASAGDLSRLADCIDSLGVVRAYQGAYAEALRLHDQALTYYRSLERPHDLTVAHQNKAWAPLQLGQAEEALARGTTRRDDPSCSRHRRRRCAGGPSDRAGALRGRHGQSGQMLC